MVHTGEGDLRTVRKQVDERLLLPGYQAPAIQPVFIIVVVVVVVVVAIVDIVVEGAEKGRQAVWV